jgi:hypothetical protein
MAVEYMWAAMKARTENPLRKLILIHLADRADENGHCFPGYESIARICECSRRAVKVHVDALVVMGFLEVTHRFNVKGQTSNGYQLLRPSEMKTNGQEGVQNLHGGVNDLHGGGEPSAHESVIESVTTTTTRMARPSIEEVREHIREKSYTFDPDHFFNYYESQGWKVGRNPMKSWKACCVTWQTKEKANKPSRVNKDKSTRGRSLKDDLTDRSWAE